MTTEGASLVPSAALGDRYRIERELGRGGMATVYLAEDLKHHRRVAIKVLGRGLAPEAGQRLFLREIETVARLRHPHILPLYDSGSAGDFLYYVMPYVEGESLRARLERERRLSIEEALAIARDVGDALAYAHGRGVIHRDIKPANILIESGHAVVADFGIARALDAAAGGMQTRTGVAFGTPAYMSPEQCAGTREPDVRSDLYSLGCVVHEMLAGQPPFSGSSVTSLMRQHLEAAPPSVTESRPEVPMEVAASLRRALAKKPSDRFDTVARFVEALAPREDLARALVLRPSRWGRLAAVAALVSITLALVTLWATRRTPRFSAGAATRITLEPGLEVGPALSPNGEMIAYAAGVRGRMQIYVRRLDGGAPLALTADSTHNHYWPRWTRDGTRVAYQEGNAIWTAPASGGPARLLLKLAARPTGFDWSPDGNQIAYAMSRNLYRRDLRGGDPVAIGTAVYQAHSVAWSPDGTRLAYVVGNAAFVYSALEFANQASSAVWIVSSDGGSPVRVSDDKALNQNPVWTPDSRSLLWVSDRDGPRDIYRMRLSGADRRPAGPPERLTTGLNAMGMSLNRSGTLLAYSVLTSTSNIWSIDLPRSGPVSITQARPVSSGNQTIESVDVSPDGRWLAFDSDRGGNFDIYTMPAQGGEAFRVTRDAGKDLMPRWSPDGRQIAFHSMRAGNRDIFTISADGSGETRRTRGPEEEYQANWSPDGRALALRVDSPRGSFVRIQSLTGEGSPRDFPIPGAGYPRWSPAGDLLSYNSSIGVGALEVSSGRNRLVAPRSLAPATPIWARDGRAIYYIAAGTDPVSIWSVPLEGGAPRRLVNFDDPGRPYTRYFSTDGTRLYMPLGIHESDLWVMKLERH